MLPDITKKLRDKVRKTIEEQELLTKNQHIVIGLSGGPDSVCLFHVLLALKDEMNLTIHPVHVNHKFRPGAAEHDQQYVEKLCQDNHLACRSFVVDCNALAKELHMTGEEAGRKARYDAFYEVAEQAAAQIAAQCGTSEEAAVRRSRSLVKIAVAQNANDQAETVLFRLLRGTGVDGLAGIAYRREERGFQVIRPLLDIYRTEIEEYCRYNRLKPVTDHTNREAIYTRNKIRLELIPYLETGYNENIEECLVRLAKIAAEDKTYLWQQADDAYRRIVTGQLTEPEDGSPVAVTMERTALAALHTSIRHRVMLRAFRQIGLDRDVSQERINAADLIIEKKQAPKTVQFPHGYRLTVAKGQVTFAKETGRKGR